MTDPARITILIADDHVMVRQGIAALLRMTPGLEVVGEASDGLEAIERFRALKPDVTLMDLRMPKLGGVDAIATLRREAPSARFVVLTTYDGDRDVRRALESGAHGYLPKDAPGEELVQAIRNVHAGLTWLPSELAQKVFTAPAETGFTGREQQVLGLLARGKSNQEIAGDLGVTESTVKAHVNSLLTKLGVTSRTQAVVVAIQRGLVSVDPASSR